MSDATRQLVATIEAIAPTLSAEQIRRVLAFALSVAGEGRPRNPSDVERGRSDREISDRGRS